MNYTHTLVLMLVLFTVAVTVGTTVLVPVEPPMCAAHVADFALPGAISNLLIAFVYIAFPLEGLRLAARHTELTGLTVAFTMFFVMCGATHFLQGLGYAGVIVPTAELRAMDALTAVTSLGVLLLFRSWGRLIDDRLPIGTDHDPTP